MARNNDGIAYVLTNFIEINDGKTFNDWFFIPPSLRDFLSEGADTTRPDLRTAKFNILKNITKDIFFSIIRIYRIE